MKHLVMPLSSVAFAIAGLVSPTAYAAWEIDPAHTHVSFQVAHLGLTQTPGLFRKVAGQVSFDDKNIEASKVTITIDTASIDTVHEARDAELRGAAWFDAEKNPKITFASTSVRRVDDKNFVIAGNLTIRGKTLPVNFNTVLTNRTTNPFMKVPQIGFVGGATIKRSDFGMMQFGAMIGDEVELKIALEMLQKP
ncbi:YceI family protein [Duganella radicis]|uniref:Polyisoprenoid-binding protein n=1 Tax=Duganella radicis TaxID=551988 RepID=A0A6L6PEB5_9BURK|nr:YceI family protein [Duganella radicis]MTV36957.1 polyisoprenoid-binding protein [Duganella radicis]